MSRVRRSMDVLPAGEPGSPKVSELFKRAKLMLSMRSEPSHSRGAPEVPEPLTIGAQYLTRYNTWKKFVRATGQALLCASPETNTSGI